MNGKRRNKFKIRPVLLIVAAVMVFMAAVPAAFAAEDIQEASSETERVPEYATVGELNGHPIGIMQGSVFDDMSRELFPDSEYYYYVTVTDLDMALESGKIDGFLCDEPTVRYMEITQTAITHQEGLVDDNAYAFIFQKDGNPELQSQVNDYIISARESGLLDELDEIWFGDDETVKKVDMSGLTGENGTLVVASDTQMPPMAYIKDGKDAGYEVDLAVRFATEYGYDIEFMYLDFSNKLAMIETGQADIGLGCITVTEERAESVDFSENEYYGGVVTAVRNTAYAAGTNPFEAIADSFYKTIIEEDRWQLLLEGLGVTAFITVLSVLGGTALGFGIFMLQRRGNRFACGFACCYSYILDGFPVIVFLMVLYYIVFGQISISADLVSIIGFTLIFSGSVFENIKGSVATVGRGQTEAALALGYRDRQVFFKVVFPQAVDRMTDPYRSGIINLLKGTAVVGYISVMDLTKMGDIIRASTFEAFFPLIIVTVLYFILEWVFAIIIKKFRISVNPRKRSEEKILKGVKR